MRWELNEGLYLRMVGYQMDRQWVRAGGGWVRGTSKGSGCVKVCREAAGKLVGELELDSRVDRCVDVKRVMDPCVSGSRYISGSNGSWLKSKRDNVVDGCGLSVDRHRAGQGVRV